MRPNFYESKSTDWAALERAAKSAERGRKVREVVLALVVGAIMSSPLWIQIALCVFAGECQ